MSAHPAQDRGPGGGPGRGPGDAFFVTALALGLARSGLGQPACVSELTALADHALLCEARELLAELSHQPAAVVERAGQLLAAAIAELNQP